MVANVRLTHKEEIANGAMAFHFAKPVGFEFRAGQYGDFTLINPPEIDAEGITRTFSIAAAPYEPGLMVATRMRDSAFKRVLRAIPLGQEIHLDAPYGDFTLHKTETVPAVFLIGGIGVTPVRSMIAQASHDRTSHRITLLFANKTLQDAPFTADFERLARENPNFKFVPVLTEELTEPWDGERGRIDGAMVKRHVSDVTGSKYYLSGPEGMVKAMRQLLVDVGVNEDNIKTEEFSGY